MRELDQTDLEILRLLVEDARRPFNEVAEAVDLSPPTVSDRVDRLRELGVIRSFTIDLDRSTLSSGTPVLVDINVRPGFVEPVQESLSEVSGVEHLFRTVDSHLLVKGNFEAGRVDEVIAENVESRAIHEYEVRLLAESSWNPQPDGVGFSLECDECGNTVTSEGESARIDGELYQFCCSSCQAQFEERYDRLSDAA